MISFSQERVQFGNLSNDASAVNLTMGTFLMNETRRQILSARRWRFLEKTKPLSTVANQQAYTLPSDFNWLEKVNVTIGTTKYTPEEVHSREEWDALNMTTTPRSDVPTKFFITQGALEFWPTPSSSTTDAITYRYGRKPKDLAVADYTTGTIVSIANGASALVGSGTTWTPQMVGKWIQITDVNTANAGDGMWYEIGAYVSATALTLATLYNGTSIAAGSALYTIGDVSLLPESYQMLPLYRALVHYFTSIKPDQLKSKLYNDMYVNLFAEMEATEAGKSSSNVLDRGVFQNRPANINNFPMSIG